MSAQSLSVIIHGGAGSPKEIQENPREVPFLKTALDAAWSALLSGQTGDKAVVAALRVLEACEYFDSGYGSYPNQQGLARCDVALMRGNGDFISLLNTRRLIHPSQAALDQFTPGKSLMAVWTDQMMARIDSASTEEKERYGWVATEAEMIAPFAVEAVRKHTANSPVSNHDTVGCVVRDAQGRIFAGTSTGGIMLKPDGRVGDSPILGAGVFADDEVCGLSATGDGEIILKSLLSSYVAADIRSFLRADPQRFEKDPQLLKTILSTELADMRRKYPKGEAGMIVIPKRGNPAYAFNSKVMSVAMRVGNSAQIELQDIRLAQ
ncbi:MAG: isoaspartyl peptidase/L-asparaginase [Deltaproteobacteria bacterium]|nr:isoaspartyl peptidase/L-asparaginase [Deltaproteobacteria bacterium]